MSKAQNTGLTLTEGTVRETVSAGKIAKYGVKLLL